MYTQNIGQTLTRERLLALYEWKNGGKMSAVKKRSVEVNYINRLDELQGIDSGWPPEEFLERFSVGGAIWRIFLLHCWQPHRYPIFDQHVWRACRYFSFDVIDELADYSDTKKVELYLNDYLMWHEQFNGTHYIHVDRALWTCGKFLKSWKLC